MSENDAIARIKGIEMPDSYFQYYSDLSSGAYTIFEKAALQISVSWYEIRLS